MSMDDNHHGYRVSVVIPVYNLGDCVARALESVLAQTRRPDEIIVVDDGSTDRTAQELEKYKDRIRYLRQDNAGVSVARNHAIRAARCEWIAFLDGDDEWMPGYLEAQLALLERNPDLIWSSGNFLRHSLHKNNCRPRLDPERARAILGDKDYFEDFFVCEW